MVGQEARKRPEEGPAGGVAGPPGSGDSSRSRGGWRTWVLVLGVFVIPILLYAAIPAVAALAIPPGRKVALSAALVVVAEGTFFVSALVLGREAVRRYRRYLDPRTWFRRTPRG
ncbi:transporter suffix domain-containing protein [Rubrobacter marinus]|uniref:Transporter suffix domain-containing protein n=1 Tax=Rubrobacter marinus TaxID=2653852 RepID=A0A6G8PT03_9ACTN|nr:transporter suffix domain-containing protein [Rubrobacter marinus]QIN77560.1 transporter suffix domain-containing protein [Rubrobacter marinus]